jgi:hypothetical protein
LVDFDDLNVFPVRMTSFYHKLTRSTSQLCDGGCIPDWGQKGVDYKATKRRGEKWDKPTRSYGQT